MRRFILSVVLVALLVCSFSANEAEGKPWKALKTELQDKIHNMVKRTAPVGHHHESDVGGMVRQVCGDAATDTKAQLDQACCLMGFETQHARTFIPMIGVEPRPIGLCADNRDHITFPALQRQARRCTECVHNE